MSDSFDPWTVTMDSAYGVSQARILVGVAVPSSRASSEPRDEPSSPALAGGFFTTEPPGKQLHTQFR